MSPPTRNRSGTSIFASRRSQTSPIVYSAITRNSTNWPTKLVYGSTYVGLNSTSPAATSRVIATTTWTLRRVDLRSAATFRRTSSSSRAESASAERTSRRPGPRSRAFSTRAATIRSADGSFRSSAKRIRAVGNGSRIRSRSTSRFSAGLIGGAAFTAVAGIACSRPTAPAMVSRSASVQVASASSRSIALRSSVAPPKNRSNRPASRPSAIASTIQRVTASTSRPTPNAAPSRIRSLRLSRGPLRPNIDGEASFGSVPRIAVTSSSTPPPATAPQRTASST
jgi:hypothetical protein